MAKNYRNSGYKRKERDYYPTPNVYIDWLLQHFVTSEKKVWEPCIGQGHMSNALVAHGFEVDGNDLTNGYDYLEDQQHHTLIITNPPYGNMAPKLVQHAIEHSDTCAFLLPFDWDAAGTRARIFIRDSKFAMKIACNRRVRWIEDSPTTGMHNYAWFIWSNQAIGKEAVLRYAPIDG